MISLWWEILKNAKLSGKAKGTSLDASKIKINVDKHDCKEKLRKLIWFNTTEPAPTPNKLFQSVGRAPSTGSYMLNIRGFNKLPEKTACNILERMKSHNLNNIENIKLYTQDKVLNIEIEVGADYRLFLEVDKKDNVIRYFISNAYTEIAWIMFSFSDIEKWMAAL